MGLDLVELVMTVEERFDVEIPDEEASELRTPRMVMDCVERKDANRSSGVLGIQKQPRKWTSEDIARGVREIVRGQLGINTFDDDDRFVEDLEVE
jgi:acyl carrier protein